MCMPPAGLCPVWHRNSSLQYINSLRLYVAVVIIIIINFLKKEQGIFLSKGFLWLGNYFIVAMIF